MELSTASVAALFGVLFGLIFVSLFVGIYMLDRQARFVLPYLAASAALIVSGGAYFLSTVTPYPAFFVVLVEVFQSLGIIALGYGFANAFSIHLRPAFLWTAFVVGAALTIAYSGQSEMSIPRLVAVSAWHGVVASYIIARLWRAPQATFQHRLFATLLTLTALAILIRPAVAAVVNMDTSLSAAEQLEIYGFLVSSIYLTAVLSLAAAIFFHLMRELVIRYRSAAVTDSLTGLLNRRGFFETVEPIVAHPATIIMLDIDRFKSINDRFGHEMGDRVIAMVGALVDRCVQPPHISARLGGEEFAVVLLRTETRAAKALAQSLRVAFELELADMLLQDGTVTASFGVASIGPDGLDKALSRADQALYRAKRDGRNRVCLANEADFSNVVQLSNSNHSASQSA